MVRKGKYDVAKELQEWLRGSGRVVIVGVGNPIRMDDFVGVKTVQDLKGKVDPSRVLLIEAETVPENHMQDIIEFKPTHILIIDAAVLGLKSGETRFMKPEELVSFPVISTHMLPLRIFCGYLETANAKMGLLLIQPERTDFGERMMPKVEITSRNIHEALLKLLS